MPLIVGLGNIGSEYAGTRHNVGFDVIDKLADTLSVTLGPGKGPFNVAEGRHRGRKVVLLKPTTYMNRSGKAVKKALHQFNMTMGECLICYDDLNLPLGTIRLRPQGSAGGHNGIGDIIDALGSRDFPRLRVGIGNDFPRGRQVDYVLSRFEADEMETLDEMLDRAHDAALCFVREGIVQAMNKYN